MHHLPWSKPGRFYKGNLHAHSDNSDGDRSPAGVVETYQTNGYEFLALTDHFQELYGFPITDTRSYRTRDFTTILGAELTGPRASGVNQDIVAIGLPLNFEPPSPGETGPHQAARAAEAGAFVGLAHPMASKVTVEDALAVEAAHAIEIFNGVVSRDKESWWLSDALAARGERKSTFAGDDNHFLERKPATPLGWVHVRTQVLDPDALLTALKAGHFYSSQGPEIVEIEIVGDQLFVACSSAQSVTLSGANGACLESTQKGLVAAEFSLDSFQGSFCRVTITDGTGMHAWSNPIWLD